jgi:hypothetical protein
VDIDSRDFDIYATGDGIHLVFKLKKAFDYRFERLRVASKLDRWGRSVNPQPQLIYCHCPDNAHADKRYVGRLEIYGTGSR